VNVQDRVAWFNSVDPLHEWHVGQDVHCLHCEGSFKAEDVKQDADGLACCPLAGCDGSPLDFSREPWGNCS
jgi:hypothetical protein